MSHANAVIHKNNIIEKENQGLFTVDIRILAQIELSIIIVMILVAKIKERIFYALLSRFTIVLVFWN